MKKWSQLFLLLSVFSTVASAQIQSPEAFLGYRLGTRFTPHHKIIDYFKHVAASTPRNVTIQPYGQTIEGRPLMVAFISAEDNISRLEQIRTNNLQLAHMNTGQSATIANPPVIIWLSYNVHGNEASSSEAAMLTLYELVSGNNSATKEWLKKAVVVMDPCINPDGRDRYVNWYNGVVGQQFNPKLSAREHREPWPGGRTNHYNFDLNRDWAWQTQPESLQRLKLYQQWVPQIHVDYHEQGINAPYYFAPAAQPYHEVITPWQRDFQVTIGRNNAKYFDANHWLYFTKEIFDLYYPSYGDTYPIYNGAIGMTYEQAGGPSSGLGAYKKEGDTLTLYSRLLHHHTTALSTIEVCAQHADRLIDEYRNFFNEAVSKGMGTYKTYVIKNEPGNSERLTALKELLAKNNIQYGSAKGNAKGYNYFTGREETFTIAEGDMVISTLQPKSALLNVLFEPRSKLVDSVTYDITAWALPYAYGLNAYALREKIATTRLQHNQQTVQNTGAEAYGYVIPWEGMQSARVVAQLLQKGVKLRFASTAFEVNGTPFAAGSVLVLKTSNNAMAAGLWKLVAALCNQQQLEAVPVNTGFVDKGYDFGSSNVRFLKPPAVAMITGTGVNSNAAGEVWFFMDNDLKYPVTLINAADFNRTDWNDFDVMILPDGNYPFLNQKDFAALQQWISKGGKLIAMENAVAQLAALTNGGIHFKKTDENKDTGKTDDYAVLKKFGEQERESISSITPGSIFKVQLDNSHPLAFGYPDYYYSLKLDDHVYEFSSDGWNVGVIKKDNLVAGFVGSALKKKLHDGLVFGVQDMGEGHIVYLADNILFRNFWQNGKLMFCNALFLVGQ